MGSLRTLLALAVVFNHATGDFVFVGPVLAVEMFYIISGFLISFILVEAKSYNNLRSFYYNRFLRLFPLYWIVACLMLPIFIIASFILGDSKFFGVYYDIDWSGRIALGLSNLLLFGQDWIMFTGVRDGVFQFVSDFQNSEIKVYQGLLVPQAWTLGVELSFYLVAPFVLANRTALYSALILSIGVRVFLIEAGLAYTDPWTYRFFPAELALFLIGALAHQVLKPFYIEIFKNNFSRLSVFGTVAVFGFCAIYFTLPLPQENSFILNNKSYILLTVFVLFLPLLFEFQNNNRWDRKIGDLSYPIYISHFMAVIPVSLALRGFRGSEYYDLVKAGAIVVLTVVISYALERLVSRRLESMRDRNKARQARRTRKSPDLLPLT